MKYVLIILFIISTFNVYSQIESLPFLRIYKSNKSIITIQLKEIDSLVHGSIVPVNLNFLDIKNITNTSARFEAKVLSKGEGTLGAFGFCWDTLQNPTIKETSIYSTWKDSLNFSSAILSLSRNTKYYARAFAYNELGVSYSNQIEFSTLNKDSLLESVKIGSQIWTSKNLDVSKYRNGDPIRHARTPEEWRDAANKGEGAWCYYNHDPKNGEIYGKLYNWHSIRDSRGLAPAGYHIPSDLEWSLLTEYLGGNLIAGFKMKSTSGWSKDSNGDNSSGFNSFPGGYCFYNGSFGLVAEGCYFWSSSEDYLSYAWNRNLYYNNKKVYRNSSSKNDGLSVRCLRD